MALTPVILFANNAQCQLGAPLTSIATTATLASGQGALFPSPTGGQYFTATLVDAATGLNREIVHVTARSGDTVTIVRAQEGTIAQAYNAGDGFNNWFTSGTAAAFNQIATEQTAAAQNFTASAGFQKFENGLILQWGAFTTATGNADAIAFPVAFPTQCIGAQVNEGNAAGWSLPSGGPTVYGTSGRSTTGMHITCVEFNGTIFAYAAGAGCYWLAWGN